MKLNYAIKFVADMDKAVAFHRDVVGLKLGYGSDDVDGFYAAREAHGVTFTEAPRDQFGQRMATFLDCEDAECGVSG